MAFSDGVIAVIITIMVLELHPPHEAGVISLEKLWPTFASYALSYLFVAIVWANHHHLLRFAHHANGRTIWANFGFLFFVSLIPFCTAYMADNRMDSLSVALYAALFLCVNVSFIFLQGVIFDQNEKDERLRALVDGAKRRNWIAFVCYGLAIPAAYVHPGFALAIIVGMAALYFVPEVKKPPARRRDQGPME
jgi:uncharacterized membrane protein